ncbi:DegV family protein [Paenibacillus senegalimassiliensis]|uniref:DegV family protein n=1 Tax=Paenibacillus senegalimassiliensis TaxID=1737426 RepID=UPI000A6DC6AF|nr:DegV family protein [Paenibacillus senegalimassiliensis]
MLNERNKNDGVERLSHKIVVDSCCDVTPELSESLGIVTVPLTITLGDKNVVDDEQLDLPSFMEEMKNCTGKVGSASPSPMLYKEAFQGAPSSFAVTISSHLSSSYASAVLGKSMIEEEDANAEVHVFDSKSACAGEVLIAVKLAKMIKEGHQRSKIISTIDSFIHDMKTYFVLDNFDNLLKNGRLNKITGKLISVLNIKLIMKADDGNIGLHSHVRGQKQIVEKLADTIGKSGKDTRGESMVIAHCNNPGLAEKLRDKIKSQFHFDEILIVPTRGISSVYANEKGIVMAF